MENTIKETTRLLLQGILTKEEADKILLDLLVVSVAKLKVCHLLCPVTDESDVAKCKNHNYGHWW